MRAISLGFATVLLTYFYYRKTGHNPLRAVDEFLQKHGYTGKKLEYIILFKRLPADDKT